MALIFDIETTGLPIYVSYGIYHSYTDISKYNDCRLVQISMMLCDSKLINTGITSYIIKPENFKICNSQIHGITNDIAEKNGVSFTIVANTFLSLLKKVNTIIAHNADFDVNIMKSELYRHGFYDIITELNKKHIICSMKTTKWLVNIRKGNWVKDPKLSELYFYVTKKEMLNAHNAVEDVINLHEALYNIYTKKLIKINI